MVILFIGDVVGSPGRKLLTACLRDLKKKYHVDFCIANGENAASGMGITRSVLLDLHQAGVDVVTLGNHTFARREILNCIDSEERLLRPLNYPAGVPGKGSGLFAAEDGKEKVAVVNLMGRVFMDPMDCPFQAADKILPELKKETKIVIVDMHAEASSEKAALAWHLDGRVTAVVGTHTHVQTADNQVLPRGTGFITDAGMTGPAEGVIGVDREIAVRRFRTSMPVHMEVARGRTLLNAVCIHADPATGKTVSMERIWLDHDEGDHR